VRAVSMLERVHLVHGMLFVESQLGKEPGILPSCCGRARNGRFRKISPPEKRAAISDQFMT
jgi:hypothetical protein